MNTKNQLASAIRIILAFTTIAIALYVRMPILYVPILVYGIARVIFWPDEKESFVIALMFLITTPILYALKFEPVAEEMAQYAYFFLSIGLLGGFLNFLFSSIDTAK